MRISDWSSDVCSSDLCVCSGFIDAIAGGGGLLTVPAMLFAGISPINELATNKMQSVMGTAIACRNFARAGQIGRAACRGKSVSVRVYLGGLRIIKKKNNQKKNNKQ